MLQARSNDGKMIVLANLTRCEIEFHRKHTAFYCPTCNQPVMVKFGPQVIPHFAHYPQANCPASFHGESITHQKGKLLLYRWLLQQRIKASLEQYISAIQQQPDLLIQYKQKYIAIEYQCSRTTIDEIHLRNLGYYSLGIQPIWILGPQLFHRIQKNRLRINTFISRLIHQFHVNQPTKLYFFCPYTLQFAIFQDIFMDTKSKAIGHLTFHPLQTTPFRDLFKHQHLNEKDILEHWKKRKRKWRLRPPVHSYGQEKRWHHWLYTKRTHVQHLPSIVYLPVRNQFMMKSPPWIWQSQLYLSFFKHLQVGDSFTFQQAKAIIRKEILQPDRFLLIKDYKHPVHHYLRLLESLQYIQQSSHQSYTMKKRIKSHPHIEQSLKMDQKIIYQLSEEWRNIEQNIKRDKR